MGEYAEIQLRHEMRRGFRAPIRTREGRNPVAAACPLCGKGIRPIRGRVEESLDQHMKAKHPPERRRGGDE